MLDDMQKASPEKERPGRQLSESRSGCCFFGASKCFLEDSRKHHEIEKFYRPVGIQIKLSIELWLQVCSTKGSSEQEEIPEVGHTTVVEVDRTGDPNGPGPRKQELASAQHLTANE